MNPRDLIETARRLTQPAAAQPTQADLRAVSTAYYALFHCLAAAAADLLTGSDRSPEWRQVYRALEHGKAERACRQQGALGAFAIEIHSFAKVFVDLWEARHEADYALEGEYSKPDVLAIINRPGTQSTSSSKAASSTGAASPFMCCSSSASHRRSEMDEQQMREIAEAAFKRQFAEIDVVGINIRRRLDHDDDPVVDVDIYYDDGCGQITGHGYSRVALEVLDKTWHEGKDDLGYTLVHLLVKAGLKQEDPAA